MPITTLDTVKTDFQISLSDTTHDATIQGYIPRAQEKIIDYCNNSFVVPGIYIHSAGIAFVSGTPATITDIDNLFVIGDLIAGDMKITGSKYNDGVYNVATVTDGTLTLATGETLTDEAAENWVRISRVKFPTGIQYEVSMLIKWMMAKEGKLVNSESVSGYSATFKTESEIMKPFNRYRKAF